MDRGVEREHIEVETMHNIQENGNRMPSMESDY